MISPRLQSAIIYLMAQLNLSFGVFFVANFLLTLSGNAIATALGAMIRDPKVSSALLTVAVLPQVFFSGLLVTTTLMPIWISWAQYLCSLRFTSGLVLLYEFEECGSADEDAYCEGFLTTYGLKQSQRSLFWGMSVAWWLVWQMLAFVFMRRSGRSFK
jgi:ABC-2 type transporter